MSTKKKKTYRFMKGNDPTISWILLDDKNESETI
jgi:hypothetical protein